MGVCRAILRQAPPAVDLAAHRDVGHGEPLTRHEGLARQVGIDAEGLGSKTRYNPLFIGLSTREMVSFIFQRKEIAIMKYVGATDWFIRWPFLLEGIVLGCIGGFIAAVALRSFYAAMAAKIYSTLAFFPLMPQYPFMNYVTAAILLAGIVIGAIGSVISLKRFLRV